MAPVISTFQTDNQPGDNSWVVNKPSGTVSGDLLLTWLFLDNNADTLATPASGWSLVNGPQDSGTDTRAYLYSKLAGGSEPATYTWTMAGNPQGVTATLRVTGVHQTTPIDQHASGQSVSGTAHLTPTITTTVNNALVIGFAGYDKGDAPPNWAPPAGWTELFDIEGEQDELITCAYITKATPGSISGTFTSDSNDTGNLFILDIAPPAVSVAVNQATETDTATVAGHSRARTYGPSLEADTATPFTRHKFMSINMASESDIAFSVAHAFRVGFGPAVETDQAGEVSLVQSFLYGPSIESDTATSFDYFKSRTYGPALETDTATSFAVLRSITVGQAMEISSNGNIGHRKERMIGQAVSTSRAFRIALPEIPVLVVVFTPSRLSATLEVR